MPPMTTIVASNGPSARRKPTRESLCDFTRPTWSGRRSGRRRRSTWPAATSRAVRSTTSRARATRWLLSGSNDNGYEPLVEAIARRYGVEAEQVATANGAAGANFQACAAVLEPGDDVLMERPGYDPLPGAARLLGANVVRFERRFEDDYALDPDEVARAMTPRTRLIIITSPHNPTGALADRAALEAIGQIAMQGRRARARRRGLPRRRRRRRCSRRRSSATAAFISTSSLTKSYGLSSLRCGWSLSSPAVAERIRRARDVIDGSGSIADRTAGHARLCATGSARGASHGAPRRQPPARSRVPARTSRDRSGPAAQQHRRLPPPPRRSATRARLPSACSPIAARPSSREVLRSAGPLPAGIRRPERGCARGAGAPGRAWMASEP